MMLRRHYPVAASLAVLFAVAIAQPASFGAERSDPPVAQEFDWWTERGIPDTTPWGQQVDAEATRMMLTWTTGPEFTNRHVDHLPRDPNVVSPRDHWGYPSGRPGYLHRVDELYSYYEALAASSPRVRMEYLGESEEGNRFAVVTVGSEENLARLEEIREGYRRLTDPRTTSPEEAERLIADLPVLHLVYSGLHSPETGHPEVTPELAYRVAVSDDPLVQRIRAGAILFIVPVTEPDGRNRVVDWYRKHGQGIYRFQDRIPGPPFWGRYIRHDNNRDGIQLTSRLYQEMVDLFERWKFPITIDLHESIPFLYVSTGTGPYNPNVPPVTRHEWQWISHYEVTSLTALGMPGVWTHGFYDGWNPAYLFWIANNRNAIGRFYETFGNSIPTTMERDLEAEGGWARTTTVEWFRANPPSARVTWSLRNNINYAQTGVLHSLHLAATNRERIVRNYRAKNEEAVALGRTEAPHAWLVPAEQERKANVAQMLNLLRRQGIEVHRADAAGSFGEAEVRQGDYVIRMDQPYRNFVKNLMEVQQYPEDAPRPYDDTAWTLALLYGITARQVDDPRILELRMSQVAGEVRLPGRVRMAGEGADWWVARYDASYQTIQARRELGSAEVYAARQAVQLPGGESFGPGAWLIPAGGMDRQRAEAWAERFGLEVVGLSDSVVSDVARHRQEFPRIAVLHSWRNTQDDGSIRYALDQMGIPYTYFPETRLREGNLRGHFDVILFPEQGRGSTAQQIFAGVEPEHGPLSYMPSEEHPALGYPASAEDITGGMGYEGLASLRDFVLEGGTLVALGSAATLPVEFGLVRGVSLRESGSLFVPGSLVRARAERPEHPILYGYGGDLAVMHRFGPYFSVSDGRKDNVLVSYAGADDLFLSGLVVGREELAGQPALISVPMGEGHVVLFGFRALHRNNTRGSFALVWNAVLNWNQLDAGLVAEAPVTTAGNAPDPVAGDGTSRALPLERGADRRHQ
jgi:hypothetical protein